MAKTSMTSTSYVIYGNFEVEGYIDKNDLIGSFFGQTEGLIGEELEFNSLLKQGKLGRIEIKIVKKNKKSKGVFEIPTSLNKTGVALVAATLESIEKIGHCNGKIIVIDIKDIRETKRKEIIIRAEELLKKLKEELPESKEMSKSIDESIKYKTIKTYERGKFFGGPNILKDQEIILVEGRADVSNMLKHDISNVVAFNGSEISEFIVKLCSKKIVTVFLDDDGGGKKELEALLDNVNVDFYTFAPKGKEVEELNFKEIKKALKNKIEVKKKSIFKKIKSIIVENNENKKFNVVKSISNYISKKDFEKIKEYIFEINNQFKYVVLDNHLNKIVFGNVLEFLKLKNTSGHILIFDGVFEGSIFKKSKEIGIKFIICKNVSKKNLVNKDGIKIKTFDEFL